MDKLRRILYRSLYFYRNLAIVFAIVTVIGVKLPDGLANLIVTAAGVLPMVYCIVKFYKLKWKRLFVIGSYRGDIENDIEISHDIPPHFYFMDNALLYSGDISIIHYTDVISVQLYSDKSRIVIVTKDRKYTLKKFVERGGVPDYPCTYVCECLRKRCPDAEFTESR